MKTKLSLLAAALFLGFGATLALARPDPAELATQNNKPATPAAKSCDMANMGGEHASGMRCGMGGSHASGMMCGMGGSPSAGMHCGMAGMAGMSCHSDAGHAGMSGAACEHQH